MTEPGLPSDLRAALYLYRAYRGASGRRQGQMEARAERGARAACEAHHIDADAVLDARFMLSEALDQLRVPLLRRLAERATA